MDPLAFIEAHAVELHALGAQRIGVFASFARGEATAESDVDVYLKFAKDRKTSDNFFAIYELLEEIFGRPSDLVTDGSLSERKARIILPTVRFPCNCTEDRQFALAASPSSRQAGTKDDHNRLNDLLERFLFQDSNLVYHQIAICGEELSRTGIAGHSQGACRKTFLREDDGASVAIGFACDLAQNPIVPTNIGQDHSRSQFRP
jgi:predicted nucleotidyltransferase